MSKFGQICWQDLTVDNATQLKDFYCSVIGWKAESVVVGDYEDYNILDSDGETVAGICHSKGSNAGIPPQWMNYVMVEDLSVSIKKCEELGGKIIDGPRKSGNQSFVFIQDPAGAYMALCQDISNQ